MYYLPRQEVARDEQAPHTNSMLQCDFSGRPEGYRYAGHRRAIRQQFALNHPPTPTLDIPATLAKSEHTHSERTRPAGCGRRLHPRDGVSITRPTCARRSTPLDDWFDANAATLNAVLPVATRNGFSTPQRRG